MRRPLTIVLATSSLLAFTLIAGCSSDKKSTTSSTPTPTASSTPTTATTPPASTADELTISSFAYNPLPLTVKAGATVKVLNNDSVDHSATSDPSGAFGVTVSRGSPQTFKAPTTAGTYKIICTFHSSMHGTLIVTS